MGAFNNFLLDVRRGYLPTFMIKFLWITVSIYVMNKNIWMWVLQDTRI